MNAISCLVSDRTISWFKGHYHGNSIVSKYEFATIIKWKLWFYRNTDPCNVDFMAHFCGNI